jgi:putative DNA primase/helicase
MGVSLQEIARALRGKVSGHQVHAPGPGHSPRDRSLVVWLSVASPDGFSVHSHAGDDFRACRDYVAAALGLAADRWRQVRAEDQDRESLSYAARKKATAEHAADIARRQRRALAIWQETRSPLDTIVETYLRSRGLDLPDEVAGDVLRFHPRCPFGEGTTTPAMVAALRCVRTSNIIGIHRTALTADGVKVGRKMLGTATGTAIMLDAEDTVSDGLNIGEGIETCLAARQLGLRPTWALGSTANIAAFPVLPGIETLTLLGELGDGGASDRACTEVGTRWHRAGRSVDIITPKIGNDLNDVVKRGASTWR